MSKEKYFQEPLVILKSKCSHVTNFIFRKLPLVGTRSPFQVQLPTRRADCLGVMGWFVTVIMMTTVISLRPANCRQLHSGFVFCFFALQLVLSFQHKDIFIDQLQTFFPLLLCFTVGAKIFLLVSCGPLHSGFVFCFFALQLVLNFQHKHIFYWPIADHCTRGVFFFSPLQLVPRYFYWPVADHCTRGLYFSLSLLCSWCSVLSIKIFYWPVADHCSQVLFL